jgi:2-oxo-4-hydroxy-4-carboxy-5-ureidoimidazoline decarboxylase
MTLQDLNRLGHAQFVAALGAIFEHSPWVAQQAFAQRPFASVEELHSKMMAAVLAAPLDARLALIRAHPELAGREAASGTLTADSTSEQARLGFHALSRSELDRMSALNRSYREKFGFPCIVALKRHASRATVIAEFERRLGNDREAEIRNALEQIGQISRARLDTLWDA